MEEKEIVETINKVVDKLARKFRFGYYEVEDMKQQGRLFAWEKMPKWDGKRKLENFLMVAVKREYINMKRNEFYRPESPCHTCIFYDPDLKKSKNACAAYKDKQSCKKFVGWEKRNKAKKNLMNFDTIDSVFETIAHRDDSVCDKLELKELIQIIEESLSKKALLIFNKVREGEKVKKVELNILRKEILYVLENKI